MASVATGLASFSFTTSPTVVDKPPNNNACFRWSTTSEFRCMERHAPFWSGWGFCGALVANKSAVAECDADSLEYPCAYANFFEFKALADKTKMRAGTCLLEACLVENDHTEMDCFSDCPKWESSAYYSPTYNAQCEAFFDENHPCGKRCYNEVGRGAPDLRCGCCPHSVPPVIAEPDYFPHVSTGVHDVHGEPWSRLRLLPPRLCRRHLLPPRVVPFGWQQYLRPALFFLGQDLSRFHA